MRELNESELIEVTGGLIWFVPAVKIAFNLASGAAGAYAFGYAIGQLAQR